MEITFWELNQNSPLFKLKEIKFWELNQNSPLFSIYNSRCLLCPAPCPNNYTGSTFNQTETTSVVARISMCLNSILAAALTLMLERRCPDANSKCPERIWQIPSPETNSQLICLLPASRRFGHKLSGEFW